MSVGEGLPTQFDRLQRTALIAAVVGLVGCAVAGVFWPKTTFPAYHAAFLFWAGLSIGSLALTVLHNLVGGNWGLPIRRLLEVGAVNLIPMAILFLPILLGLSSIYPWADEKLVEHSELLQGKVESGYLTPVGFAIRSGIAFVLWIVTALLAHRGSRRQDQAENPDTVRGIEPVSGLLMALVFFTGTFAAIDWGMTREPEWYSSMYGPMVLIGWGLETFAFSIVVATLLSKYPPMSQVATPTRMHDLGNLMLAFTMLWAYTSFSQFLIIWSGNLAEEAPWYLRRTSGGWEFIGAALILFHFFVPFFCLLFRDLKRNPRALMAVAAGLLVMHAIDLTWLSLPANAQWVEAANSQETVGLTYPLSPLDLLLVLVAFVGIGGVWLASFAWQLRDQPLVIRAALSPNNGQNAHSPAGGH